MSMAVPRIRGSKVVHDTLKVVYDTKDDVIAAIVLLHNIYLIDDDEMRRLAEKAERMWPDGDQGK